MLLDRFDLDLRGPLHNDNEHFCGGVGCFEVDGGGRRRFVVAD